MATTQEDLDAKRAELAALNEELVEVKTEAAGDAEQRERDETARKLDAEIERKKRLINEARVLSGQPVEAPPADPEISDEERKKITAREAAAAAAAEAEAAAAAKTAGSTAPAAPAKEGK
ncbi:hypothetical protein Mbo2_018 [Rhodococcus phage Mbo2]|uniref:Uncharacterized protein n=1 Tax=Rhodococcus phage Mbo2 TaxID=2936911 RepID=A0A9E7IGJ1_9CAUD|nr:hypothetical protein Mbo2_018 [Rhodococcus phage Mbo2]